MDSEMPVHAQVLSPYAFSTEESRLFENQHTEQEGKPLSHPNLSENSLSWTNLKTESIQEERNPQSHFRRKSPLNRK